MMPITASILLLSGLLLGTGQADTTITVPATARLDVQTQGGEIIVDTWARNEVRVQAAHGSRDQIRVVTSGQVVRVRAEPTSGNVGIVDYRITVPVGMDLDLSGVYADILVRGTRGQVRAQTVHGDVTVNGGSGQVSAEAVQGMVLVEGARGTVNARSVAGQVRMRDVQGDITAQAVSGAVVLENVQSANVSASSVSGQVFYDGPIAAGGRYSFTSHSGGVTVAVPANPNATFSIAQLSGSFTSSLPGLATASTGSSAGRRRTLTAGDGSAVVELESFSGSIRVVGRGEVAAPAPQSPR
jgi:DUF4097 and DUF4098 domain-containing protein YvlB